MNIRKRFYVTLGCFVMFIVSNVDAMIHDPRAIDADPTTATSPIAPRLTGLGDHKFPVTTSNPESQVFFEQGFRLTLGFNHSEALRSFKEAIRLDPNNAMAYWGWALSLGPNLNLPMQPAVVPAAYGAMQKAVSMKANVTPRERALIEAAAVRFTDDPEAARAPFDRAYADAMAKVVEQFPNDADMLTLYAAAMMNTNPWDYWYKDGTPKSSTVKVMNALNKAISLNPDHPGAHHYLIHTVEAFRPELGVQSADRLGELMPSAGHLVHMPSHIFMRVGRYGDSYDANALATKADESYITQCRAQGIYPLVYYPHNIHFLAWSAMFQGRSVEALDAARKVAIKIKPTPEENVFGLYESFASQPLYVMVRFGKWDEILKEASPNSSSVFMNGVLHYARGLAFAHKGDLDQAADELYRLTGIREEVQKDEAYHVGFAAAGTLLHIAELVLRGEHVAKSGDVHAGIAHLERAARLEDTLLYNEPPDWYFPVRHVLGALLMDANLPAEAEAVYWDDLRRNPDNGFSLFGLKLSLEAQGNKPVADEIGRRFDKAWSSADVKLRSSRY
jgi:tetratricopeptide (TPR) repeat protein